MAQAIPDTQKAHAHEIDRQVGNFMRRQRILSGLTQSSVAQGIGVSFQQINKYENATNRIAASTLYWLAQYLNMAPHEFFAGAKQHNVDMKAAKLQDKHQREQDGRQRDRINRRETLELVRAFDEIPKPELRAAFKALIDAFAAERRD